MKVIFDKKTGEILDLFDSLKSIINYEKIAEENIKNSEEGKLSSYLKTASNIKLQEILTNEINGYDDAKLYFPKDETFFNLISPIEIWENPHKEDFEKYIKYLSGMKKEEILSRVKDFLVKRIPVSSSKEKNINAGANNEGIKNAQAGSSQILDNENNNLKAFFDLLKIAELSVESKWMFSCLINEPLEFLNTLCSIILKYSKRYTHLFKREKSELVRFTNEQKNLIDENGEKYIVDILEHFLKKDYISTLKEVVVTTSFIQDIYINIEEETHRAVVVLGVNYKKCMTNIMKKSREKNNILVLKNMADETRYKILKLLSKKDYYGLELANILSITTPSVSYHMNYLLMAGLVSVTKKEQKVYYSLNREGLKNTFEFLYKEFKL